MATERQLPPEIVSLVHHVELNKAGWWDKAIERLILGLLLWLDRPLTLEELQAALRACPG